MDLIEQLTTETFPAFCRERGLKCTVQRRAVFSAVRQVMGGHPSVDSIWVAVSGIISSFASQAFATSVLSSGKRSHKGHKAISSGSENLLTLQQQTRRIPWNSRDRRRKRT